MKLTAQEIAYLIAALEALRGDDRETAERCYVLDQGFSAFEQSDFDELVGRLCIAAKALDAQGGAL